MKITENLEINIDLIKKQLPVDKSFDIVGRPLKIGNASAYILFIDGFAKAEAMIHVMKGLQGVTDESGEAARALLLQSIPYIEAAMTDDLDDAIEQVLMGQVALFVDGDKNAVVIDAREYPAREPSQSEIEKVTRGSRDDLVETLIFNTALIRRRVRDRGMTLDRKSVV